MMSQRLVLAFDADSDTLQAFCREWKVITGKLFHQLFLSMQILGWPEARQKPCVCEPRYLFAFVPMKQGAALSLWCHREATPCRAQKKLSDMNLPNCGSSYHVCSWPPIRRRFHRAERSLGDQRLTELPKVFNLAHTCRTCCFSEVLAMNMSRG